MVVVVESKVAPEQVDEALRRAQDELRRALRAPGEQGQSRFFQSRTDPSSFLYLGVWSSRTDFEARFTARQRSAVEQAMLNPIAPRYFRILSTFERILVPMDLVVCQVVNGPPSAASPLRDFFAELVRRRGLGPPGLVLSLICQEIDAPGNFVLVTGWRSPEAMAAIVSNVGVDFDAQIAAAGATYHRFVGQTRYDSSLQAGRATTARPDRPLVDDP